MGGRLVDKNLNFLIQKRVSCLLVSLHDITDIRNPVHQKVPLISRISPCQPVSALSVTPLTPRESCVPEAIDTGKRSLPIGYAAARTRRPFLRERR